MYEFLMLKNLVEDGVELTYGKLTLCNLCHYQTFRGNRKWQIFCDDRREKYFNVYKNLDDALRKFLELKQKISSRIR